MALGLGISVEHEIRTNAPSVDLLIQLTYAGARESSLGSLPEGLELSVPINAPWKKGAAVVDFDSLDAAAKNQGLVHLIDELPPVVSSLLETPTYDRFVTNIMFLSRVR